eukprot:5055041-Amphidinium_carterae.2
MALCRGTSKRPRAGRHDCPTAPTTEEHKAPCGSAVRADAGECKARNEGLLQWAYLELNSTTVGKV